MPTSDGAKSGLTRRDTLRLATAVGVLGAGLGARTAEAAETVHLFLKAGFTSVFVKFELPSADATKAPEVLQSIDLTRHFVAANGKFAPGPYALRLYTVKQNAKPVIVMEQRVTAEQERTTPPR